MPENYPKKLPLVSIVMPVFNRKHITLRCLKRLQSVECDGFKIKVIVVDDGSTDGTSIAIQNHYPDTVLLHGDGNLWWAGALNLGVKHALSVRSDYVLTLNDDTNFKNDFITEMFSVANERPNSIVGSLIVYKDIAGRFTHFHAGVFLSPFLKNISQNIIQASDIGQSKIIDADALPGRSLLIPAHIFKEIGIFNDRMFPHGTADYEFTLRAKNAGINNVITTKSIVYTEINENNFTIFLIWSDWPTYFKSFFNFKFSNNFKTLFNTAFMQKPFLVGLFSSALALARIIKWTYLKLITNKQDLKRKLLAKTKDAAVSAGITKT